VSRIYLYRPALLQDLAIVEILRISDSIIVRRSITLHMKNPIFFAFAAAFAISTIFIVFGWNLIDNFGTDMISITNTDIKPDPIPAANRKDDRETIQNPNINPGNVISRISTDKKIVALTFDADMTYGMERQLKNGKVKSWYNEDVIKNLEETKTPATLFLTGLWIKNYPEETKKLADNPLFEIANHSYSHPGFTTPCFNLPTIPDTSDKEEITKTDELLKEYAPGYKKYFRFPGFCMDEFDIKEVEQYGYQIFNANVKGLDGFAYNIGKIVSRVVSGVKPGSIVVLHMHGGPDAPETGKALPEIIRQLKEKGYEFVKISDLIRNAG